MRRSMLQVCALLLLSACAREEPRVQDATIPNTTETAQRVLPARPNQPILATALRVGRSSEHGAYLTDETGRALYLFEEDSLNRSTCYNACATVWPPLLAVHGAPATAADSAVQKKMIGSFTRRDGTTQITYNGRPLYYYTGDRAPGDTKGQDLTDRFGEWYLVSPRGSRVKE